MPFRRRGPFVPAVVVLVALLLSACEGADDSHVFSLDATGSVEGLTFLDLNRNGQASGNEPRLAGVEVRALPAGGRSAVATAVTDTAGGFLLEQLPVGSYALEVRGGPLGDTLVLTGISPSPLEVRADATQDAAVGVSFPVRSATELQDEPEGRRVYVEGIALNSRGAVGDDAVHVWDGQRASRARDVASFTMSPGDSVRILGRTVREAGRMVLTEAQGFRVSERPAPEPFQVSTAEAASGGNGAALGDGLVRVTEATVSEVRSVSGGVLATVSDGSGSLFVRIRNQHLSAAGVPLEAGALLSATGLLLAREGEGAWELRTRSGDDLGVEAAGTIEGRAFFDLDGNGSFGSADLPLEGIRLTLFRQDDATTPIEVVESGGDGRFVIGPVEVANYILQVDPATIPDSLVLRGVEPEVIRVPTNDVVSVGVAISHPTVSVAEARELAEGHTVFVEGIALNSRSALGDESVHIRGGDRALRTRDVGTPSILSGDRVRLRGRTGRARGQPALDEVTPFILSAGSTPGPLILTSADAASARGGDADADAVRVREATIVSASGSGGIWLVVLDDGSGEVEAHVRLATVGWTEQQAEDRLTAGREVTLTGLLIPAGAGGPWRIHPRTGSDIVLDP